MARFVERKMSGCTSEVLVHGVFRREEDEWLRFEKHPDGTLCALLRNG